MASVSTKIVPFPKPPARRGEYELAFLPAALEIAETPPVTDRTRNRGHHYCPFLCGAGVGITGQRRCRRDCLW
jgi:hypothetical protein